MTTTNDTHAWPFFEVGDHVRAYIGDARGDFVGAVTAVASFADRYDLQSVEINGRWTSSGEAGVHTFAATWIRRIEDPAAE